MRFITLTFLILLIINPLTVLGNTNSNSIPVIDLATDPQKVLFDLSNIKPGDSITRNLVINNNGSSDFRYNTNSTYLKGSEIFYKQFDLTVKDSKGILFQDKLYKFIEIAPRLLKSNSQEQLTFHLELPMAVGNEFQGMEVDFKIDLYVEGDVPVGGVLPETATDMFNYMIGGSVLLVGGLFLYQYQRKRKQNIDKT
ncbi:TasA family protein [Bacillus sp. DJP31]|uniref:TasA family protein n=1 Tax=Bacillus sp. DJP31 TaxID=3409789 RepID=UPI003BB6BB7D